MVHAGPDDPPELEFYRIRPFELSGRLMAHALLYVPTPSNIVLKPKYGRQPLWYCKKGCCHGPHIYEEWWIGPPNGDPTDLSGWRRPFFDTPAFPHDVWAMAQPVQYNNTWIWVDNGLVWGLPQNRLAGLSSLSNAEFSTAPFTMEADALSSLWLDADSLWGQKKQFGDVDWCKGGCNGVGGSDEGRQAYIMAELLDADNSKAIPGFEKEKCVLMNTSGKTPLRWAKDIAQLKQLEQTVAGKSVRLRFYFRDATLYAAGSD